MDRRDLCAYLNENGIDAKAVGAFLGEGKQHAVYRFQHDKVIKIPKRSLYMNLYGALAYQTVSQDVELLRNAMGEFLPETHVVQGTQAASYFIVQEWLDKVTYINTTNAALIGPQLREVFALNRSMVRLHSRSVDFLGNMGFKRSLLASLLRNRALALMTNAVIVDKHGTYALKIVDTNLSRLDRENTSLLHWSIDRVHLEISNLLLSDNFGVRSLGKDRQLRN